MQQRSGGCDPDRRSGPMLPGNILSVPALSAASRPNASFVRLLSTFPRLTQKQHEVLRFVAENRTSKEIAWELGISESAVNQRIEGVRHRTGSPPRAELARAYRCFLGQGQPDPIPDCKPIPGQILQVADGERPDQNRPAIEPAGSLGFADLALADAVPFTLRAPWETGGKERAPDEAGLRDMALAYRAVPAMLGGTNTVFGRIAAMLAIAAGLLIVAMAELAVAIELSRLS